MGKASLASKGDAKVERRQTETWGVRMNNAIGYIACTLVLATFSMKSMWTLRITAIASNVAFILYATVAHLLPILILHAILLPLNLLRLRQELRRR